MLVATLCRLGLMIKLVSIPDFPLGRCNTLVQAAARIELLGKERHFSVLIFGWCGLLRLKGCLEKYTASQTLDQGLLLLLFVRFGVNDLGVRLAGDGGKGSNLRQRNGSFETIACTGPPVPTYTSPSSRTQMPHDESFIVEVQGPECMFTIPLPEDDGRPDWVLGAFSVHSRYHDILHFVTTPVEDEWSAVNTAFIDSSGLL